MKIRPIHVYVAAISVFAIASQAFLPWSDVLSLTNGELAGLAILTGLGFASEGLALTVLFGGTAGHSSITFLPLTACVVVFGPGPASLFIAATGFVAERIISDKAPIRAYFNVAQYVLSTTIAGLVFLSWGGVPQVLNGSERFEFQLLPPLLFGLTFLAVNHVAVSTAAAIDQRKPIGKIILASVGSAGSNLLYDLLVLPIALVVAFSYVELYIPGLLLVILPLLFIRNSYLVRHKLQQANRDLLKALVKAIETRDPYTSGHSMRVATLATRIANELHLSKRRVADVETAALLHDIGKIEGVYSEILSKPAALSAAEREVIESHVTKGVELLQTLASYPKAILEGVRHHHERIDGSGYPDGLKGDSIPLIARIINVCDAIDAMLSDRPYRRALPAEHVHGELVRCAGRHFDVGVVSAVVGSDILQEHAATLRGTVSASDDHPVVETGAEIIPRWITQSGRSRLPASLRQGGPGGLAAPFGQRPREE